MKLLTPALILLLTAAAADAAGPALIDAARYASLQEAIDALPPEGGQVAIPPGIWEIQQPLELRTGEVTLQGSGPATHIVNLNEAGEPAVRLRAADRDANPRSRIWRLELRNLRLSGNPQSGHGIYAEGINEIFINGVGVDRHGGDGIRLVDCYENPRVIGNMITYNGAAGLHVDRGHDILVSSNQFEENLDAVVCVDSFNLTVNGNSIDDHLRHGVVIENTHASLVGNNMIEECKGTGVVLDRDCYGITVNGNAFAQDEGGAVALIDAWGTTISGNAFTRLRQASITIGPKAGRITVTGNNFSNSYLGEGRLKGAYPARGIVLNGTEDILISGNTFTGLEGPAVSAQADCRRVLVVGNLMADLHRENNGRGPALQLEGVADLILENNLLPADR